MWALNHIGFDTPGEEWSLYLPKKKKALELLTFYEHIFKHIVTSLKPIFQLFKEF